MAKDENKKQQLKTFGKQKKKQDRTEISMESDKNNIAQTEKKKEIEKKQIEKTKNRPFNFFRQEQVRDD